MSRRGGNKKGFLRTEHRVDEPAMQTIREAWRKLYSNNGDGMMILQNGLDFKESSSTAVEMQLNQNKVTNAEQIAMLFGLSPDVLSGRADDRTYINSIRTAVLPVVSAFEMALNRALLLEKEKNSKYFVIDTSELLKADILTRYQAYQIGLAANFLQPDEIRFKENLAPLGLDFIKLGLNDVLYDPKTKQIYTPNTDSHAKIDDAGLQSGDEGDIIAEKRYNDKHDEKGRFARKDGGAAGTSSLKMSRAEIKKVSSEISTNYSRYAGKKKCVHYSLWHNEYFAYHFKNNGFADYDFVKKVKS